MAGAEPVAIAMFSKTPTAPLLLTPKAFEVMASALI